jgi:hypothetical protein
MLAFRKDGNQHAWGLGQSFGRTVSRTDEPQPDGLVPSRVGKADAVHAEFRVRTQRNMEQTQRVPTSNKV